MIEKSLGFFGLFNSVNITELLNHTIRPHACMNVMVSCNSHNGIAEAFL